MIKVSAPGKLFLSGEWAVLEMGNPGLVAAVDKRVYAEIEEQQHLSYNPYISITVDDFNIRNVRASFDGDRLNYVDEIADEEKNRLIFIKGAIETALKYIQKCMPFRIRSWGEMSQIKLETGEAKKIGFGSSAAAVVATVAAILAFHGMDIEKRHTKDIIYKLSAMAHYFAQGKVGSAFDVAASTYGGVFVYKRFDPLWLVERMEKKEDVKNIAESEWPGFHVEELDIPEGFSLAIAWTKEEASTSAMIKQMDNFKKENPEEYKKVYNDIGKLVSEIIARWKKNEKERIIELLRKNEDYLRELGEKSGVKIETADLRKLSEIANHNGAAGKLSGAGGGDCGIAVCFDENLSRKIRSEWEKSGLHLIDATIDREGVRVDG